MALRIQGRLQSNILALLYALGSGYQDFLLALVLVVTSGPLVSTQWFFISLCVSVVVFPRR